MKKRLCEEDLRQVVWLSEPELSPEGDRAAYTRAVSDDRSGKNIPRVMEVSLPNGEARPASETTKRQHMPRYSPDGAYLAFLSDDHKVDRLYVKEIKTGQEREITGFSVSEYAWSPDGRRIAACVPLPKDRRGNPMAVTNEAEYDAWRREMDHAPRFTEALMYKLDEAFGFLDGSGAALYLIDIPTGGVRPLFSEDNPIASPAFSADGEKIYCFCRLHSREESLKWTIIRYDPATGSRREIPAKHAVSAGVPVFEKNGRPVYAGYSEETNRTELFLVDENADRDIPLLSPDGCEGVDPAIIGDDRNGGMGCPVRTDGQGNIYFLSGKDGRMFVSDIAGKEALSGGCIQGFSAPERGSAVFLRSSSVHPGELYLKNMNTGEETRLTRDNDWILDYGAAQPEKITVEQDSHTVHGWALLPEGSEACPAVLYIHGGPECFFGEDIFFFEAQSLRAAGFAVLWCNPRGSAGYGPEYLKGAYGQEAVDDLMGFVDACLARYPRIDGKRLGVTGGSYGGYMTNKLTLKTDRFRAAAAQRTWIDPATSYGTGDMGFMSGSGKTDFREYMLNRAQGSILRDIRKLHTPTLILHGEKDVRCGEEQADQLFNVIRALRPEVPCRLVLFPGENHGLTRTGLMHHRIRHMLEIRQWMERFLGKEDAP